MVGTTSCSLSYAVNWLGREGYALLAFDGYNGVFVHESIWSVVQQIFQGLVLPQDEFQCYRKSRVWVQAFSPYYVRDWFFTSANTHDVMDWIWANFSRLAGEEGFGDCP